MSVRMIVILGCAVLGVSFLSACGGSDEEVRTTTQTTGQELMDLQHARDSGAISQKQYEEQKEAILERNE